MWDPVAMLSTCYAYSSRRWELARRTVSIFGGNLSLHNILRRHAECLQPQAVGPFPYAKGHFLGYSHRTAALLVELFDCCGDEAYALGTRRTAPNYHPFFNKLLPPTHRDHPSNKVVAAITSRSMYHPPNH